MKILVSGSSGLIGSALVPALFLAGHDVIRLVRYPTEGPGEIFWHNSKFGPGTVDSFGAVINLAGETVNQSWTEHSKRRMRDSRVNSAHALAEMLSRGEKRPKTFINASATGFYGDRGEEVLTESSEPGKNFLSELCQAWEDSTIPAASSGVRTVLLRFGVVFSQGGGALKKMLTPFRLGMGGRIGSGKQYMPWVHIDDVVGAIVHALDDPKLEGAANVVAPQQATNAEFTQALGEVLGRPTVFPMPAFAARLIFGQMADELLLASQRVEPVKLAASGYKFRHPELKEALTSILNPPPLPETAKFAAVDEQQSTKPGV